MKQSLSLNMFRDAFTQCNRENQFSYEALELIFDYYEDYERDTGEELELDVIAICCSFAESTTQEAIDSYNIDVAGVDSDEEKAELVADYFSNNTALIGVTSDNTFVYVQF
jgi:predicted ArsR family transcriptional regulator